MRYVLAAAVIALIFAVSSGSLRAQEPAEYSEEEGDANASRYTDCYVCEFEPLEISIPLWLPFVSGFAEAEEDDEEGPERELLRVNTKLRFAFMARLALRIWRFGIGGEFVGAYFGEQIVTEFRPGAEREIGTLKLSVLMGNITATYFTPPFPIRATNRTLLFALSPYVGVRHLRIGLEPIEREIDLLDQRITYWDPIVGTKFDLDFRSGWILGGKLDIGGFGAGATFAVFATARGEYRFNDWFSMWAGWIVYYTHYRFEDRNLLEEVTLLVHGPAVSFNFFPF